MDTQKTNNEQKFTTEQSIYHLIDRVLTLSGRTFGAINRALRELDLSEPVANLLWHLDPKRPAPLMGELAEKLYCDPSTVTFLVGKLEDRGLVERRPSERDGRAKVVITTESGRRLREELVEIVTTQSPLGALTADEREQLLEILLNAVPYEEDPAQPDCFE